MRIQRESERGAAALVVVISLFTLGLAIVTVSLSYNTANMQATGGAQEDCELQMLTMAAVNHAWAEIESQTDQDGDGVLGAIGVANPIGFSDSRGRAIGEYQAWVVNKAADPVNDPPQYVLHVRAAIPTMASARRRQAAEAQIQYTPNFVLSPNAGAINISGPLTSDPDLSDWNSPDFYIDGGNAPAIVFNDANARTNFTEDNSIDVDWFNNSLDTKINGTPLDTFNRPGSPSTFDAPFVLTNQAAFTAEMLNDYRDALRGYAHGLIHATDSGSGSGAGVTVDYAGAAADGVVLVHELPTVKDGAGSGKPRIVTNHTFGDTSNPQTVLIDTSKFHGGHESMTDNHGDSGAGRTITGAGTLVILHPIGSKNDNTNGKMINLNWEGDVFVIGYPADRSTGVGTNASTDNLLYVSRADWNIDGNLVVLTAGSTEASLEVNGNGGAGQASVVVNGSVMMFGEAGTNEAEIDIETGAYFEVNGFLGLYGSRIELENQSSTSTDFKVNGTMALGFPLDSTRNDDLRFKVRGRAQFTYNQANVEAAIESLAQLQSQIDLNNTDLDSLDFESHGMVSKNTSNWDAWQLELADIIANGTEHGVDIALIEANY